MDDLIIGADDENELIKLYGELNEILSSAGFVLRKWHSSNQKVLNYIPESKKEGSMQINNSEVIKTLGIVWEPAGDEFRYQWPVVNQNPKVTKRVVLSELSALYDPLGLICPIIAKAKILMQDLWILKLAWDESLPMNLHSQWTEFRENRKSISSIRVPRYALAKNKTEKIELHGFSDSPMRAYGCCIYIRSIQKDGVTVRLWGAKSRVAPLKTKSLPRLELLAAELLAKLVHKTQENFLHRIDQIYLWTDSEIVLDWLSAHPCKWNRFVANRVATIQELTKEALWRHVPSKLNTADLVSRGANVDDLQNSRWFEGPEFLYKEIDKWPLQKRRHHEHQIEERKRDAVAALHVQVQAEDDLADWLDSHSNFLKVQRTVARIINAFRKRGTKNSNVTAETLEEGFHRIAYCLQQRYFSEEVKNLKTKGEVRTSSIIRNLSPFLDKREGVELIRVGGRLNLAELPYQTKHPILLPSKSQCVKSFVRYLHEKYHHAGAQALMAILRQKVWIVHARKLIRMVTNQCIICFKCRPILENQVMGDLPAARVGQCRPFLISGVDFFGPIMTTQRLRGVRLTKTYGAVFVCFATKAVHFEVVSDLTAQAFIAALKRFIARTGLCQQLWCDNGTNFVGANRKLDEFKEAFCKQQKTITTLGLEIGIQFKHIPARSPHFGGLWEAAVKSAKYHLDRILTQAHLTYEELNTVLAEIEAILNSRPLTQISNDTSDEIVLTPGHFLTGGPLIGIAELMIEESDISLSDRWQRITRMQQHFWKRWQREYLHELQQKAKWVKSYRNINEGDIVLVAEDNLPSKQWRMGKVERVSKDSKGAVRVVSIKTKTGCIQRAIHNIAPIPKE